MKSSKPSADKLCVEYSKKDAEHLNTLRKIVQIALVQISEIQENTLAKAGADKPKKGKKQFVLELGDATIERIITSIETHYPDGSITCDDGNKGACCTGPCPC
jgi:hypothetical protein